MTDAGGSAEPDGAEPDGVEIFDGPPAPPGADAAPLAYSVEPKDAPLAHPVLRAFAFVLDGIATVLIVIVAVLGGLSAGVWEAFWAVPLVPLAAAVLDTVLTAFRGITPAKVVLGIRVVDATTATPIGLARSTLRSLVIVAPVALGTLLTYLGSFLPWEVQEVYGNGLGFLTFVPVAGWVALLIVLAARPRWRGLQDLAGRSVVVRVR
jgi:hypothetical protein